jgi:hypothetical protein
VHKGVIKIEINSPIRIRPAATSTVRQAHRRQGIGVLTNAVHTFVIYTYKLQQYRELRLQLYVICLAIVICRTKRKINLNNLKIQIPTVFFSLHRMDNLKNGLRLFGSAKAFVPVI